MDEGLTASAVRLAGEVVISDQPGACIRRSRTRYGFTQTWLAPHLGVRRESLSRIESGHSKPTLDVVSRFARIMALAGHVRTEAARLETAAGTPDPATFHGAGRTLGLVPETSEAIAARAIEAYDEKRRELLEGIGSNVGGSR